MGVTPHRATDGRLDDLPWMLIVGLGALALVRPLLHVFGITEASGSPTMVQLTVTLVISLLWISAAVIARLSRPVLTLVLTGLAYGVFSTVLSAILSPLLTGELQGPVANPIALVPLLALNALWGCVAGAVALAVGRALYGRHRGA